MGTVLAGTKGEPSQLAAVGPRTRVVTLSVGASDAGFSAVATACNTLVVVPGAPSCDVALTVTANAAIEAATVRAGGTYVDLVPVFAGHSTCEADPTRSWINGLLLADPVASFHPNALGQAAIADALAEASSGR